MSRTKRRKNYVVENNTTWDRKGKKVALEFTQDLRWSVDIPTEGTGNIWMSVYGELMEGQIYLDRIYRPMNKEEHWWKQRMMHGESRTRSARSPNHWHRLNRQKQNRSINKQEMLKWLKANGEYEPMFEENPRDCWWDWS
jgi:hypothetical protein